MSVFFLFLLAIATGTLSTLWLIPEPDLGRGYFQMNALVVLGLLALAVAVVALSPLAPFGRPIGHSALAAGVAGAVLYYGAVYTERWRLGKIPLALALAGCVAALLAAGRELVQGLAPLPHRMPLLTAALLSSALLLGWSLIAMLLGHWYLVAPKLTFRHLTVFCWVLLGTVLLRCVSVALTLWAAASVDALVEPHPLRVLASFGGQGMFFWFRLLWGLAVPLGLAAMALHCARQRSNQSATGILYVLVVGTLIGEITALYLAVTTGVPV
jgi:hypothetical protein